jgi:tryptophan-rich sensory protein
VQLVLNGLWSFLFFKEHEIGGALADIIVLWLTILITIFIFSRISKTAAWLLVPYISWVSFAALLNYAIWQLNT